MSKTRHVTLANGSYIRRETRLYFGGRVSHAYSILRDIRTPGATGAHRTDWCKVPAHWTKVIAATDAALDKETT
jgi:hypothetical protein